MLSVSERGSYFSKPPKEDPMYLSLGTSNTVKYFVNLYYAPDCRKQKSEAARGI